LYLVVVLKADGNLEDTRKATKSLPENHHIVPCRQER
jgi:hypothetical protein